MDRRIHSSAQHVQWTMPSGNVHACHIGTRVPGSHYLFLPGLTRCIARLMGMVSFTQPRVASLYVARPHHRTELCMAACVFFCTARWCPGPRIPSAKTAPCTASHILLVTSSFVLVPWPMQLLSCGFCHPLLPVNTPFLALPSLLGLVSRHVSFCRSVLKGTSFKLIGDGCPIDPSEKEQVPRHRLQIVSTDAIAHLLRSHGHCRRRHGRGRGRRDLADVGGRHRASDAAHRERNPRAQGAFEDLLGHTEPCEDVLWQRMCLENKRWWRIMDAIPSSWRWRK